MLEVRRVTRVTTWWRQLSFRAIILVWNRKGKIGIGIAKWADVQIAVSKATHDAYKHVISVPLTEAGTIPYEISRTYKWAQVKLLPAAPGTWLKAWSSVRMVLELTGCSNVLSKIMWSTNKLNNALATVQALWSFKMGKFPERLKKNKDAENVQEDAIVTATSSISDASTADIKPVSEKKSTKKTPSNDA